jgi:hypothetical protein
VKTTPASEGDTDFVDIDSIVTRNW